MDVLEGYVSVERAQEHYGVIIEDGQIRGMTPERQAQQDPTSSGKDRRKRTRVDL